jgi:hypothetical protein
VDDESGGDARSATLVGMDLPESWRVGATPQGASSRVRSSARRPLHGVRLAPGVDPDDPLVRAWAAGLVLPGDGVLGEWAAAALLGVPATWLDGRDNRGERLLVPVVVPPPTRSYARRGFRVVQAPLDPADVDLADGIPVTSGVRTAFDLLRHAPNLRQAVARGDACLRYRLTTSAALAEYVAQRAGWRGIERARRAVPLLDGRSESPKESELRVIWVGSGIGIPVPQRTVLDELGVFIARVDLLDVKAGVVGEYQGLLHRQGSRPWGDTVRGRGLDGVGLEVVEFWSPDLTVDLRVVQALVAVYGRAGRRDPSTRTYLLLR